MWTVSLTYRVWLISVLCVCNKRMTPVHSYWTVKSIRIKATYIWFLIFVYISSSLNSVMYNLMDFSPGLCDWDEKSKLEVLHVTGLQTMTIYVCVCVWCSNPSSSNKNNSTGGTVDSCKHSWTLWSDPSLGPARLGSPLSYSTVTALEMMSFIARKEVIKRSLLVLDET